MAPQFFHVIVACRVPTPLELFEDMLESPSQTNTIALCPNWGRLEEQIKTMQDKGIATVDMDDEGKPPPLPAVDFLYADVRVDQEFFFGKYFDDLQCHTLFYYDNGAVTTPEFRLRLITSVTVQCRTKCFNSYRLSNTLLSKKYRFEEIDVLWKHCETHSLFPRMKIDTINNKATILPASRLPTETDLFLLEVCCPRFNLKLAAPL